MCGAVCSTSREESCRRMHMGSWGRVPRYDRIRSRHIEWSTHLGGAKGLVRFMILLINKMMTMSLVGSGGPPGGLSFSC